MKKTAERPFGLPVSFHSLESFLTPEQEAE